MKYARLILAAYILWPLYFFAQDGSSCKAAIPLTLNGVIGNYPSSTSSSGYLLCTGSGNSPITWFSFTSNATAQCSLLTISASDNQPCEIGLFSSCSGSIISASSMCFYDGNGLWAPAASSPLSPNTTYYLRVKTSSACTISISGQYYTPPNDDCNGAFSISTDGLNDNNSCHSAGPGVTPSQLCAFSLENTAFYQFYVASTGYSVINLNNISCDNGANNNNNGFQIGFFTGSCSSLSWLSCASGSGSFVQATTPLLNAGTKVYVAVDGNAGSNCAYTISGINIVSVLSEQIKNFSAWQNANTNIIKWTKLNESDCYYEVEKSVNGNEFFTIGEVLGRPNGNSEVTYNFTDHSPAGTSFYRLRQTDAQGKVALSNVIKLEQKNSNDFQILFSTIGASLAKLNIVSGHNDKYDYLVMNLQGSQLMRGSFSCSKGNNFFELNLSSLIAGEYFLVLKSQTKFYNKAFIKGN